MITEEILSSIDNIDDCVMEAEMNVIDAMYDYCQKAYMIYENCDDIDCSYFDIFYESASNNTNNKGIGSKIKSMARKIWGVIKTIFSFIGKQLMKIVNFIKRIFTGKKKAGTADQAAIEAGLKGNNSKPSGKRNVTVVFAKDEQTNVTTESTTVLNTEDTSQTSRVTRQNISAELVVEAKEFSVLLTEGDGQQLEFVYANAAWGDNESLRTPGQSTHHNDWYKVASICLISDSDLLNEFSNVVDELLKVIDEKQITQNVSDAYNHFTVFFNRKRQIERDIYNNLNPRYTMDTNMMTNMQRIISNITNKIDKFIVTETEYENSELMKSLQTCLNFVRNVQMGLNCITGALRSVYTIDDRFVHSINDPEVLDTFVGSMIENGIPSKYIAYNSWLACGNNIVDINKYKPIWGQSRIIFFPNDKPDSVYKVGLSSMGSSANKCETFVYNSITKKESKEPSCLAKPNKLYPKSAVLDMERCDTSERIDSNTANSWAESLNKDIKNLQLPFTIGDLHEGNFGKKRNGTWCVIDYGSVNKM